jgi:hypothetical protein
VLNGFTIAQATSLGLVGVGVYLLIKLTAPSAVSPQPSALVKTTVPQADS